MNNDLYSTALSFFKDGKYVEAYSILSDSATTLSSKEAILLDECKKQITNQYNLLIRDCIQQGDWETACSKKEEYCLRYDFDSMIRDIQIPMKAKSYLLRKTKDAPAIIVVAGFLIVLTVILIVWKCSQNDSGDIQVTNDVTSAATVNEETVGAADNPAVDSTLEDKSQSYSFIGKTFSGGGNGGGIGISMTIQFMDNDKCICTSDWYYGPGEEKAQAEGAYKVTGTHLTIKCRRPYDDLEMEFNFGIYENGRILGFDNSNHSTPDLEGSMGNDYMTLELIENTSQEFSYYHNLRFSYRIAYPSSFTQMPEPENSDGCKIYRDEQTYIVVYGEYNVQEETIEDRFQIEKNESTTYSRLKNNWFVISGYTDNGCIYYQKTVLRGDTFLTAILNYPKEEDEYFSHIISKIFKEFPN